MKSLKPSAATPTTEAHPMSDETRVDVLAVLDLASRDMASPNQIADVRHAVVKLIVALEKIRDYEGHVSTPVRNSVKKSAIARAALANLGAKP